MRNKQTLLMFCFFISLTSCSIYDTEFDCPPDLGVPCTSSSDIESMIIETGEGRPDVFLGKETQAIISCSDYSPIQAPKKVRKVWICNHITKYGHNIEGHYQKDFLENDFQNFNANFTQVHQQKEKE